MQQIAHTILLISALLWLGGCAAINSQSPVKGTQRSVPTSDLQALAALNRTIVTDPAALDYVNGRLAKLDKELPAPCKCQIFIDGSSGYEAYTLSHKTIVLSAGLLAQAKSEDEIAAVIAHELSHATRSEVENSNARGMLMDAARVGYVAGNRHANVAYGEAVENLARGFIYNRWSAEQEMQADAFAVSLLGKAGYSPEGMKMAVRRLSEYSREAAAHKDAPAACLTMSDDHKKYDADWAACASAISDADATVYLPGKLRLKQAMTEIWKLPPEQRRNHVLTNRPRFASVDYLYSMNALVADNRVSLRQALKKIEKRQIPPSLEKNVNVYQRLAMANQILGNKAQAQHYILKTFHADYRTAATFRSLMAYADEQKNPKLVREILSDVLKDLGWSDTLLPEETYLAERYDLGLYKAETSVRCKLNGATDTAVYQRCSDYLKKAKTASGLNWSEI